MESSAALGRQAHRLFVYMLLFVAGRLVGRGRCDAAAEEDVKRARRGQKNVVFEDWGW